ncbi:hypothetical protein [Ensifer aridi]|uniref:hypothetical protein n=1 Tax=Ensifer aridi TaxID=1708715 RepID=UPI000A10B744|nr:hypothetical protein [Ensifer aridi]
MHSLDYATEETATVNTGQARSAEGNISLRWLDAALNPPRHWPETHPIRLQWHHASNNSLSNLPDDLPVELRTLNVRYHRQSGLPNARSSGEARYIRLISPPGAAVQRFDVFDRQLLNTATSVIAWRPCRHVTAIERKNKSMALKRIWECADAMTYEDL